jgi:hypothetical protein
METEIRNPTFQEVIVKVEKENRPIRKPNRKVRKIYLNDMFMFFSIVHTFLL